uniref:Uncharacterized protein n=1 Tax=Fagus sylvatica TaxID=28930 RepID=A0A2N9FR75_FAGSY
MKGGNGLKDQPPSPPSSHRDLLLLRPLDARSSTTSHWPGRHSPVDRLQPSRSTVHHGTAQQSTVNARTTDPCVLCRGYVNCTNSDDEGIRTTEKGKDVAVYQVSDKSDDDSVHRLDLRDIGDFDNLSMDADAGQDNDDEMDSIDSDYDDRNLRMDD